MKDWNLILDLVNFVAFWLNFWISFDSRKVHRNEKKKGGVLSMKHSAAMPSMATAIFRTWAFDRDETSGTTVTIADNCINPSIRIDVPFVSSSLPWDMQHINAAPAICQSFWVKKTQQSANATNSSLQFFFEKNLSKKIILLQSQIAALSPLWLAQGPRSHQVRLESHQVSLRPVPWQFENTGKKLIQKKKTSEKHVFGSIISSSCSTAPLLVSIFLPMEYIDRYFGDYSWTTKLVLAFHIPVCGNVLNLQPALQGKSQVIIRLHSNRGQRHLNRTLMGW